MSEATTIDAVQIAADLRRFANFALTTSMKETMLAAAKHLEGEKPKGEPDGIP